MTDIFLSILLIVASIILIVVGIILVGVFKRLQSTAAHLEHTLTNIDALTEQSTAVLRDVEPSVRKWSTSSEQLHDNIVEPLISKASSVVNLLPGDWKKHAVTALKRTVATSSPSRSKKK